MQNTRLKKVGLSATLVIAVAVGAAAFPALQERVYLPLAAPDRAVAPVPAEFALDASAQPASAASPAADATASLEASAADAASAPESASDASSEAAADAIPAAAQKRTAPFTRPYDEPAGSRIVVSIDKRWLWLIMEGDTLLSAPVAVGMNRGFEFAGRSFHFKTPRGRRTILRKETDPVWTVPEWHYYERARQQGLEVVQLEADSRVDLSDGTVLVVRGNDVGRINHFGNFWPFTPGNEIIFDGRIFVPPLNTQQRRVPDALGPYKLDMGNGYLIHGTHIYNEQSVGRAVSHGCVRMTNEDLERLYWMVEPGTVVEIR